MTEPAVDVDGEALRLRSKGRSYARISRELKLERGADAQKAFQRAVQRLPDDERQQVSKQESARLDRLERQVNADENGTDKERSRKLAVIKRLRTLLVAPPT